MSRLSIRSWTEPFPSHEGVAVVFDIFRCSTTIHCLASRELGRLWVAPSLKEAQDHPTLKSMRVFSELSQPSDCLERFDNSPHFALGHASARESNLVATTTGTPAMFAARNFRKVYVGSLVSFSALVHALAKEEGPITLIPAAIPDWEHVEDEVAAMAVATALEGFANLPEFVKQCGMQARERILASDRPEILFKKLPTGREDIAIALDLDRFSQVLTLDFSKDPIFAEVVCSTG